MLVKYTPEFFRQKQIEKGVDGYAKWLKGEYRFWQATILAKRNNKGLLGALIAGKMNKGVAAASNFINNVKMLEQEMENMEKQYGLSLFSGDERLSQRFNAEQRSENKY